MQVIAHEPHSWFLLEHDGALYLDVNCSYSAVGFSILVRLDEGETEGYARGGRAFLSTLASELEATALSTSSSRNVELQLGSAVAEAVARWRASGGPGAG